MKIYGFVLINLNGVWEEIDWFGQDLTSREVLDQIKMISGAYGKNWKFPADTGLEFSNIYVSCKDWNHVFYGKSAITKLRKFLKENPDA